MTGNFAVDVPRYNAVFAAMSKQWPELPGDMKVCMCDPVAFNSLDIVTFAVSDYSHGPGDERTDTEHGALDVRIYKPASDKPLPLMIYFPGGGYIAGNLDTEDAHCRFFAAKTPCLVISVDYPKVPQVKLDDIINVGTLAVPWCRSKATELGDDSSRTILCGGSAGAFLSAQVAYRMTAEGDHTSVTGCVLLFGVALHWNYDGKYKDKYTAWDENGNGGTPVFGLELAKFIWFHATSPFSRTILSKFPPCYIVTAEKDCFRDDGTLLDYRLKESGVRSRLDYYAGLPHYFHAFPALPVAHEMMDKAVEGVRFVLE